MLLSHKMAEHLWEFHFGNNWPGPDLRSALDDITWQEATSRIYDLNTIAMLVYHLNYYITALNRAMRGEVLDYEDNISFNHPPIETPQDWHELTSRVLSEAEESSDLIRAMPEDKIWQALPEKNSGNFFRLISGITEHCYYHLGQIIVIKKIIRHKQFMEKTEN